MSPNELLLRSGFSEYYEMVIALDYAERIFGPLDDGRTSARAVTAPQAAERRYLSHVVSSGVSGGLATLSRFSVPESAANACGVPAGITTKSPV